MSRPWIEESWRLLLFVAAALLIGAFTGQSGWLLSISLLLYIGNLLLRLRRLEQWVRHHDRDPPDLDGVFDEVIYHLHRHRKRQHARRSRIAQELRQFQRSARILPDATVLLDAHDQILWFNRAATDLLGLRSSDTGHAISGLIRSPQFIRLLREHSSDSNYDTLEMMSPVDERILLDLRISSGRNEQRLLLARDVTQLNRLLNMRRDFVANVSHELRTPLTVVIGYLESLLDDDIQETDPATLKSLLGKIYAPAQRMKTLVEDLLLLSRLDTDTMLNAENCPLVEMPALLRSAARDCEQLSKGQHSFSYRIDPQLKLRGVEQELYSVASNLLGNAIRYTPPGGKIELQWQVDPDGRARLSVTDNGPGIAPAHIERLTERFYRVDVGRSRQAGGTGLGLSIVKQVIRRHGAELRIDSQPGHGSSFHCLFPVNRTLVQAARKLAPASAHDAAVTNARP